MQQMRAILAVTVGILVAVADGRSLVHGAPAPAPASGNLTAPALAKDEPFVVSFRVEVDEDQDGSSTAAKLARTINTPASPVQMPGSVARVQGTAFLPPSARAPMNVASAPAEIASTLGEEASLHALSERAAALAEDNAMAMQKLRRRLRAAGMAEQQAFNFNIPPEPPTTVPPPSLGYLVYEALIHTPGPLRAPNVGA
mmetsp:Transcript_38660/g.70370  ORF Transcript_38660/g.70370 Transcript_38660/m.70370 type:complete len:199 (+) Transcript_38660:94-690(+)